MESNKEYFKKINEDNLKIQELLNSLLKEYNRAAEIKDLRLSKASQQINDLMIFLEEKNNMLIERIQQLHEKDILLREKINQLQVTENILQETRNILQDKIKMIHERDSKIFYLEVELNNIKNSIPYRIYARTIKPIMKRIRR